MTKKHEIDLDIYSKLPRLLTKPMEMALGPRGDLYPVFEAVTQDDRLRLEIRSRSFNVYYQGGSLLRVSGLKPPWTMEFDEKYFKGGTLKVPSPPQKCMGASDSRAWVQAFPDLIAGMEDWWTRNDKGELAHSQAIAAVNSAKNGLPWGDYLVLDLEFQWAHRRFDIVAAKRRPTEEEPTGWIEPDFVFVEVKSKYGACSGKSGLGIHARDYRDIRMARAGERVQEIKLEYQDVVAQKQRLGLLDKSLRFKRFSEIEPLLLIVLVDLDPDAASLRKSLAEVRAVSDDLHNDGRIQSMRLFSSDYFMTEGKLVSIQQCAPTLGI